MKTVGISELKSKLSAYLAGLESGEEILVTERGQPIARIVPIDVAATPEDLLELAREGIVRLPRHEAVRPRPRVKDPRGRLLAALLEERREAT